VGVKMIYWDGLIQHGGVLVIGDGGHARQLFQFHMRDDAGEDPGLLGLTRNCAAVGTACAMMPRAVFDQLGGFDPHLVVLHGDVDLGLRILNRGYRVVWSPEVLVRHHEAATRRWRHHPDDEARFAQRWERVIRAGDPFYNPNLEPLIDYEIRESPLVGSARALAEARAPSDGPPTKPPMLIDIDEPPAERPSPERFEPVTMARTLIEAEHQARYQWATQAVRGRTVLDAGCGLGYGTVVLAEAGAAHAIGIDLSAHAIADARALAGSQPVEYRVGDLHELPFDARAFDLVVCFEAIEHMHDVEGALDEFKRVLVADGLLLISSPNRGIYPGGNPYHLNELTAEELHETLKRRFAHVSLFRQHPWTASAILDDPGLLSEDPGRPLELNTRKTVAVEPGSELYTLAAASNAEVPALSGVSILTDPLEVGRLVHGTEDAVRRAGSALDEAERARTRLLESEQAGEDARREALALRARIDALEGSQSWQLTAPLRRAKRIARRLRAG
jgi:2-polyprenyl-3-methyl-5-hydroxy-6-metoxy-1,4-benzoquinol methylase